MENTVLVIGSGSREQCLAWKLAQSVHVKTVYLFPGNAGTDYLHRECKKIQHTTTLLNLDDLDVLGTWCLSECISLVVVGPEVPLANGICDLLETLSVKCFGPKSSAARIESSKLYAKDFMIRHSIPTARYKSFNDVDLACHHIHEANYPALVVKASGLAAGKGVIVAKNREEACASVKIVLKDKKFGDAGSEIIVEELLEGEEISVLCFSDGRHVSVMPPSQDHKRQLDGDLGPNTGGMGAYCPCPQVSSTTLDYIEQEILENAVLGMREEGRPYVGVLYAGLMLTETGPKVLEFNCRFGDPECQVILPLLENDLFEVMMACINGTLDTYPLKWKSNSSAVAVVMASSGYPGSYKKGNVISGVESVEAMDSVQIFQAGTKTNKDGELITSGGRVLSVVALKDDLKSCVALALKAIKVVQFHGCFHRNDIASKGIIFLNRKHLTYADSGVSIVNGDAFISKISPIAKRTVRPGCLPSLGGFGGIFDLAAAGYKNPVLVSGSDGVGTKLMLAHSCNLHKTVGIDLVAMCVNDILTHNAEPLFFLDYYACGKLSSEVARDVVEGIGKACQAAGCALIGGETAEMPGMYAEQAYDLGGFAVGAYEKGRDANLPCVDRIIPGDVVIGIASTGIHSNGFSLVRQIVNNCSLKLDEISPFDERHTLGECLLTATAIYSKQLLPILRGNNGVKAAAHVTGGGIVGNLPRVLPASVGASLDARLWTIPPVFRWIAKEGNVKSGEMLKTFNCGIGMCLVVDSGYADAVLLQCNKNLSSTSLKATKIGRVVPRSMLEDQVTVHNIDKALSSICWSSENDFKVNGQHSASPHQGIIANMNSDCRKPVTNVAVFISGSGTNLQALLEHQRSTPGCSYRICLVVSNKENVYGLTRAQKYGISTKVVNHKLYKTREAFDKVVDGLLFEANVDLVCLAGFMRLLSGWFVHKWRGKVINIHPSLLPSFRGIDAHKQVLDAGVRITGCSVHFVVEEMDAGAIIAQDSVPVYPNDSVDSLQERVKKVEHKVYPKALDLVSRQIAILNESENKVVWKNIA